LTWTWLHEKPKLIEEDYKTRYKEPVKKVHKLGQDWYLGTGIAWKDHPLKNYIPEWAGTKCKNCNSKNTKIIAAQWSVAFHSGDIYWDCEIFCEDCGKYTQRAYAEND